VVSCAHMKKPRNPRLRGFFVSGRFRTRPCSRACPLPRRCDATRRKRW
jgi:hypothetical protein